MTDASITPDLSAQLAHLREAGAQHYDPVRFRFLEAKVARLRQRRRPAPARHREKLASDMAAYRARFEQAHEDAQERLAQFEHDAGEEIVAPLRALLETGELKALKRLATHLKQRQEPSPLARLKDAFADTQDDSEITDGDSPLDALLKQQERVVLAHQPATRPKNKRRKKHSPQPAGQQRELKAMRHIRTAQARLNTQKRIDRALAEAPDEAGPLNSHRLVTQSVQTLRNISPDYLNRFVEYMDTLLWLEKIAKKG